MQKTALFMDHRIRVALRMTTPDKFTGMSKRMKLSSAVRRGIFTRANVGNGRLPFGMSVQLHRNPHKRAARITGRGGTDKTAVMGIEMRQERNEPGSRFGCRECKKKILQAEVRHDVEAGAAYALKLLRSEGVLTIASTGRYPASGNW
jgi:hypothetical protein